MSDPIDMLEMVRNITAHIPFNSFLGFVPTEVSPGYLRMEVPFRAEFVGDVLRPALHGGLIAVLIDAVSGSAAWTLVTPPDERVSTIDMRVDYLRPGRLEALGAEARVQRKGSAVAVVSARVYHLSTPDETIAEGKAVFSIRNVKKTPPAAPPPVASGQ